MDVLENHSRSLTIVLEISIHQLLYEYFCQCRFSKKGINSFFPKYLVLLTQFNIFCQITLFHILLHSGNSNIIRPQTLQGPRVFWEARKLIPKPNRVLQLTHVHMFSTYEEHISDTQLAFRIGWLNFKCGTKTTIQVCYWREK